VSILFLLFCVGVAMWYLTWKKSEDWWIKGVVLGGAFYVVLAWVIPFARATGMCSLGGCTAVAASRCGL